MRYETPLQTAVRGARKDQVEYKTLKQVTQNVKIILDCRLVWGYCKDADGLGKGKATSCQVQTSLF